MRQCGRGHCCYCIYLCIYDYLGNSIFDDLINFIEYLNTNKLVGTLKTQRDHSPADTADTADTADRVECTKIHGHSHQTSSNKRSTAYHLINQYGNILHDDPE